MVSRLYIRSAFESARARRSHLPLIALSLAAAGHIGLGAWLLSQIFLPASPAQTDLRSPPMDWRTITLESPKPAMPNASPLSNAVHALDSPTPTHVETLPGETSPRHPRPRS